MIYTIGHSTHSLEGFLSLLNKHHVRLLADIRSMPGSRHAPQYNMEVLKFGLGIENVSYEWLPALGGHRKFDPNSPEQFSEIRNRSFRGYAQYMTTEPFAEGIDNLLGWEARFGVVAIMCAEAVWWRCHRRMVAEHLLLQHGHDVKHIMPNGSVQVVEARWLALV